MSGKSFERGGRRGRGGIVGAVGGIGHSNFIFIPLILRAWLEFEYIENWPIAGFQCHAIQNQNQNRSIDEVQNLRKERR